MKHVAEAQALALVEGILEIHQQDRDALPGSFVKKIREARDLLRKRRDEGNRESHLTRRAIDDI